MDILYHSTRGDASEITASQAVLNGLAPDGGLYVPAQIPLLETAPAWFALVADYLALIEVPIEEYIKFVQGCSYQEFREICDKADFKITEAFILLRKERSNNGEND